MIRPEDVDVQPLRNQAGKSRILFSECLLAGGVKGQSDEDREGREGHEAVEGHETSEGYETGEGHEGETQNSSQNMSEELRAVIGKPMAALGVWDGVAEWLLPTFISVSSLR